MPVDFLWITCHSTWWVSETGDVGLTSAEPVDCYLRRRKMNGVFAWCLGVVVSANARLRRDDRGLTQSTENAILLAGAVTVAGIIVAVITAYVKGHLPD